MADNLKILKQNLDGVIDPAAGVGQILAQEHNDVITELIEKVGKYTGFPFSAIKEAPNNVYSQGMLSFNNNVFNDINYFNITIHNKTIDGNSIERILKLLKTKSVIHFKDFIGRSVFFEYYGYSSDTDANGIQIFNIVVKGFSENINYSYQINENELCFIEFINNNNQEIKLVTSSRNYQIDDNQAILIVNADITLTLTENLQQNFNCEVEVMGDFTLTNAVNPNVTMSPLVNSTLTEDKMQTIFRVPNTNIFRVKGENS